MHEIVTSDIILELLYQPYLLASGVWTTDVKSTIHPLVATITIIMHEIVTSDI
jgi:hypothetical protein